MVSFRQRKAISIVLALAGVVCIALALAVLSGGQTQAQVSSFTVNTTFDEQDAYPGDGICESKPGNGMCSLRAAVQEANAWVNADIIILPAGVYTLTLAGILEDQARFGDLDILYNLSLQGAGAGVTIIDGNQLDRVIEIPWASSEVTISGVTIRNGNVDFPTSIGEGPPWLVENGGCVLSLATLTLRHSVVTGCRAGDEGGGIYAEQALIMEDAMVLGNQAGYAGGGVSVSGMALVTPTPPPFVTLTPATPQPSPSPTWTPFPLETPTPTATSSPVLVPLEQTGGIRIGDVSRVLLTPTSTSTPTPTPAYPPAAAGGATLRNSVIEDNVAVRGGGVYNRGQLTLDNVVLRHNRAVDTAAPLCCSEGGGLEPSGGGIYSEGMLTLFNSRVISNTASAQGGGMVNRSTAESYRSEFVDNRAGSDGGGIINFSWLRLNDGTVSHNEADGFGGGIANSDWGTYPYGILILQGSTVSENLSHSKGGGIANGTLASMGYFRQEQLWLTNSTVSGNLADGSGGGVYTGLGEFNAVFLNNTTITANVADADGDEEGDGGGIFNRLGQVQLRNSILAANQDRSQGAQRPDCWTPRRVLSWGYNLIGDGSSCPIEGITAGNLLGIDPLLGPLQHNGGSTETHALLIGSQAIDAGNPNGCVSDSYRLLIADQRGYMRPVDGTGDGQAVCDIGAYEFKAMPVSYRFLPLLRVH